MVRARRPIHDLPTPLILGLGFSIMATASLLWVFTGAADRSDRVHFLVAGLGLLISCAIGAAHLMVRSRRPSAGPHRNELSTYDAVTGLPMRRLFLVLVNQALVRATSTHRLVAVLVIALEQCRPGSTVGQLQNQTLVLRVQAARIKGALQAHDAVARLDEDRVAVILDHLEGVDRALALARHIQQTMSLPLVVEGQEILLSCRIGMAVAPFDGADGETLLAGASQALNSQRDDISIKFLSDVTAPPTPAAPESDAPQGMLSSDRTALTGHR